ncbi:MAG: hypothetical protein V1773_19775 [bacterium]
MSFTKLILFYFSFSLILLFVGCKKDSETESNINYPTIDTTICTADASFKVNEYTIINNCWGKGTIQDYMQCIFIKKNINEMSVGFSWQWPADNNDVKAYPEILFGWKPWNSSSTTTKLPIRVGSIKTLKASYTSITTSLYGVGNTAFDLWITSSKTPTVSDITREVMIWTKNFGQTPGGSKVATVTIDNVEYDLYKGNWDWTYLAFVNKGVSGITNVNLDKFLAYLFENGYISPNENLASIEFGNEIVNGSGNTTIRNYNITVEENPGGIL